ncbi:MAG TPA: DUF3108 domain-containing protein [Candidatus Binataceae bacterium]|nr:DUF3108 domain-containing protein [Candidatus Binataceae bacterium]
MVVIAAAAVAASGGAARCASGGDRLRPEHEVSSRAGRSDAGDALLLARPLPDGVRVPSYSPGPMPYHPGQQLIYQASWIGIPAAGGKVVLNPNYDDPKLLSAEIWISTNRLTDKLYRMRDYLREDFTANSLKPAEINIRQNEGRRHDTFKVTFDQRDHVVTLVKHGPRGQQTRKFLSYNPSGPVSGAMMALSQPLEAGDSLSFDSFSGTTRYVFELKVVRRERIGTPLGEFDAFRIVPSVTYLSDGKINDEVHDTTLWVSADARRLPLRIESAVFIGSVRIDLVKVIDAAPTQAAAR